MALRSLSTVDLRRELERRERGADKLLAKRKSLAARLAEIDAELSDLGLDGGPARRGRKIGRPKGRRSSGRPPKGGRLRRASNKLTLAEALAKAVRAGSTVSPAQAAAAVKRAGYKTGSRTFGIQVATTLARSSAFKKTGRGAYQRKSGAGPVSVRRGPKPKMGHKPRKTAKRRHKPGRKVARRTRSRAKPVAQTPAAASAP